MTRRRTAARLGIGLALALAASACGSGGGSGGQTAGPAAPTTAAEAACVKKENGSGCLPLAPESQRVDRATPAFSRPTEITNPLLPIAEVTQSLQLGTADGKPFRAEVTLLPGHQGHHLGRAGGGEPDPSVRRLQRTGASWRSRSTGTPRPTTGRSGTSARTSSITRMGWSPTPTAPGWPAGTGRRA